METLEMIVYDSEDECPYIPGFTARMPLRRPNQKLKNSEFDQRLAEGDRRYGRYLYRTKCAHCQACQAIRIPVDDFSPSKSQRKTLRKGDAELETIVRQPLIDQEHVDLFNAHSRKKRLNKNDRSLDLKDYHLFLADTCCDTVEFAYFYHRQLVGVSIADRGDSSLSAVYCFYDLDFARLSPGTFSVLKQIEQCQEWGLQYLYLGYFVAENEHMRYKSNYYPHQRLIDGHWEGFVKSR